ncbi:hypothetical protein OAJ18_01955 [Pelagibacteraceae bacterium]|nr:hypothetical protein [Pelagibacteraceae bacterium]
MNDLHFKLKAKWEKLEKDDGCPSELNKINTVDYKQLSKIFKDSDIKKIDKLIEDFYTGNILIIKKCFTKEFFEKVKSYLKANFDNQKSAFYKIKEGCPNFHTVVGNKESSKYAIPSNRHDYYFFPWNRKKEKLDLFHYFYPKWRLAKSLSGLRKDQFENNTPKDKDTVDRLLIRIYPNNSGFLNTHTDPPVFRLGTSIIMSKRGSDFEKGGLYFIKNKKIFNVENYFDIGDIVLFYTTLKHGVEKISSNKNKFKSGDRWWANFSQPTSDEAEKRILQKAVY